MPTVNMSEFLNDGFVIVEDSVLHLAHMPEQLSPARRRPNSATLGAALHATSSYNSRGYQRPQVVGCGKRIWRPELPTQCKPFCVHQDMRKAAAEQQKPARPQSCPQVRRPAEATTEQLKQNWMEKEAALTLDEALREGWHPTTPDRPTSVATNENGETSESKPEKQTSNQSRERAARPSSAAGRKQLHRPWSAPNFSPAPADPDSPRSPGCKVTKLREVTVLKWSTPDSHDRLVVHRWRRNCFRAVVSAP